jgi:hypothetical protein
MAPPRFGACDLLKDGLLPELFPEIPVLVYAGLFAEIWDA